jgi:subtilisin family serine protease
LFFLAVLPVDPWSLVRVDQPDLPGAEATSDRGSLLLEPPTDLPYRVEPVPEIDQIDASELDPEGLWLSEESRDVLRAQEWLDRGYDGEGLKIAIFDVQWFNTEEGWHEAELGDYSTQDCFAHRSCELPMDTLRPRYSFEVGSHGVACAEVVRDLAPAAELFLVRVNGLTTLENASQWAARNDIDLVSMSLSFFNESFYDGTGPLNAAVAPIAAEGGLLVTSAGNYAMEHWSEPWNDLNLDGFHDFPWGYSYLPIYYGEGGQRLQLTWNDYANCGDADIDLYLYNDEGELLGRSNIRQSTDGDSCGPVERINFTMQEEGWTYLLVQLVHGDPRLEFDVMSRNGEVWQSMAGSSLTDPGSAADVFTVGAVRADGYATNGPESFSSHGPSHAGLPKPDIAGPDGLTSSIYGPVGFYGTSAATPAVTGALALVMSAFPEKSPREAADWLAAHAASERSGWQEADPGLGAGRARLPSPPGTSNPICGGGGALLLMPLVGSLRRRRRRAAPQ